MPLKPRKRAVAKRKGSKVPKVPGPKIWTLTRADKEFSKFIRERDGRCMFPGCDVSEFEKLQCSHYIGRQHRGTRFDPDNCIALCWHHHFKSKLLGYEYQKQQEGLHGWDGRYTLHMKQWLGEERFTALVRRSQETTPQSRAILQLMQLLGAL